jgi:short-subunit dehydrogenase
VWVAFSALATLALWALERTGSLDYTTYRATKTALRFWARSMAAELKDRAIPGEYALAGRYRDADFLRTVQDQARGRHPQREVQADDTAWTDRPAGGNGQAILFLGSAD